LRAAGVYGPAMLKTSPRSVAVIGGGPAGLMAAEKLLDRGFSVDLYDAKPSLGRKLLMAGKSGLNLTHDENFRAMLKRFGTRTPKLEPHLRAFGPTEIKAWAEGLGIEIFTGTSGRVFPKVMKASPLLRAWLQRLGTAGLRVHSRHVWKGWSDDGALQFESPDGAVKATPDATVLAMGGASWPRLGSDGAWTVPLIARGIAPAYFKPTNCGFDVEWSAHFRDRFAGQPVKSCVLSVNGAPVPGDFMITRNGIEGGAVYGLSAPLRDQITTKRAAMMLVNLTPDRDPERLLKALSRPRGKRSLSNFLRQATGLDGVKAGLLREILPAASFETPRILAKAIQSLGIVVTAPRPLSEAISTAGGIRFEDLDSRLMLTKMPGVFAAGEMLDWEAPTGGYLLTACLATGHAAGLGAADWLETAPT
jgi:uncharacterized flavoprotein (TIGR03862 family)